MDPFTQRMLERARARQEKIDQKLAVSGQTVTKRKPLTENLIQEKRLESPVKSPMKSLKDSTPTARRMSRDSPKSSPVRSPSTRNKVLSPRRNDVVVTKKEFGKPKGGERNSDVSLEINIVHREDIQIEVQVEERDVPISVYDATAKKGSVKVTEIKDNAPMEADNSNDTETHASAGLRHKVKSRLDRLGVLYSDKADLSSPIHSTEREFTVATPPTVEKQKAATKKFGRLAALADQINNWEDDLTHHGHQPEPAKKSSKVDESTLDVSIHSLHDINKVLHKAKTAKSTKTVNSSTFLKPAQRKEKNIFAALEPKGASTTPSALAAPNMATMVVSTPPPIVAKKPSIKKYKAPTPPGDTLDSEHCESEKNKENNVLQCEDSDNDAECKQTKPEAAESKPAERGSPVVKRLGARLNGNADRNSVLSKAAMFEAGSPRSKEKDPAEMSLRERKALFEKNKGAAIIPKAPFGLAPSVKTLHGDKAEKPKTSKPIVTHKPTKPVNSQEHSRSNSKENLPEDQTVGVGIKGKLAALFNKEQTISETTIANKFKQEREKEMEMLQNRFNYKTKEETVEHDAESDDDQNDPSEDAPLMRSTVSLNQANKKPEIIANIPKLGFDKTRSEINLHRDNTDVVSLQPNKRRSSQDSPIVTAVLDDVKRIKVADKKESRTNGAILKQPQSIYPHLSDIETDNSRNDEYSDCGGSSEDNLDDKLNKSDDWAETSFGREVMNVVKKNNSSYRKAVQTDSDESNSGMNSELDEMLDEALDDDSEGPTPPKMNKHGNTLSSKSFVYEHGSPSKQVKSPPAANFKTPLKSGAGFKSPKKTEIATPRGDKGAELIHSVSFYRRTQNASSTPSTPMRVIRHASPQRDEAASGDVTANVTTVREKVRELQAEISKQQTVISQASQALNLCAATVEFSGSTEQAEGERLLLLATHRRQACLHEAQRLQVEGAGPGAAAGMAALSVRNLTVPLRRDYVRQLSADGAVGHHMVCLLKCRDRVLATSMQLTRPQAAVVSFPDEIRMEGLASDFKVTVEVYLLQASKEVLPHDVKYHITNKKSSSKLLTPKSKVSELKAPRIQSPAGPQAVRSPQFQLHGYCIFALQQASRKSFTLNKVPASSPLEGSVNVEISARVLVPPPNPHSAFLTAFDDVSGLGAWHRRWFTLKPPRLSYWKYPDDEQRKMPIGDIDLSTVVSERVVRAPRELCARAHTLLLESSVPVGLVPDSGSLVYFTRADGTPVRRHLLAADSARDCDIWLEKLNQALEYVRCCIADDQQ